MLMVHHGKGIGGAPKSMSYVAKALVDQGVDVEVLFLQKSEAIELFQNINCKKTVIKYPVYYFYHMSKWVRLWQVHKLLAQAASVFLHLLWVSPRFIQKAKPDVVYINSSVLPEWIVVSKLLKKKVVVHVREAVSGGHFGFRQRVLSFLTKRFSDKIIFISRHNMKQMLQEESDDVRVIYNYELGSCLIDESEKVYDFIYVGGESNIKGWALISALLGSDMDFKLVLAGGYGEETKKKLLSDNRVVFLGFSTMLRSYIAASRFLISPFLEPHFSRPIIEAYSVGTVPIATDLPGITEQVSESSGFLFNRNDATEFFKVLERCLRMPISDYESLVSEGELMFERYFSQKNEARIVSLIMSVGKDSGSGFEI